METPKWFCSLSNGNTYYEGKNQYQIIKGELSPWQRLLKHIEKENLQITSVGLYMDNGQRWNLPAIGKNPKFKAFDDAEKPISYRFFRKAGMDILRGRQQEPDIYSVIEANYLNKILQTWVSQDGKSSWSLIV